MAKDNQQLQAQVNKLQKDLDELKRVYSVHQHNNVDGTNYLRKNIILDQDQSLVVGSEQIISAPPGYSPTDGYNYYGTIVVGQDMRTAVVAESPNMQMVLTHVPDQASLFSFITATRNPQLSPPETVSVTAGGNTVTLSYDMVTDYTGAYINIYDSSRTLVETQVVASNTSSVVTISGTWLNSTSGGYCEIYTPVFMGRTSYVFRRLYVEEGTASGGVRFGVGATANGQNGLLYMDATGDLYWKSKAGVSTKLN